MTYYLQHRKDDNEEWRNVNYANTADSSLDNIFAYNPTPKHGKNYREGIAYIMGFYQGVANMRLPVEQQTNLPFFGQFRIVSVHGDSVEVIHAFTKSP